MNKLSIKANILLDCLHVNGTYNIEKFMLTELVYCEQTGDKMPGNVSFSLEFTFTWREKQNKCVYAPEAHQFK